MKSFIVSISLILFAGCATQTKPSQQTKFVQKFSPTGRAISSIPSTIPGVSVANSHIVELDENKITLVRGNYPWSDSEIDELKKIGIKRVLIFKNNKQDDVINLKERLAQRGFDNNQIMHIDFDWADNNNFKAGCLKYLQGIRYLSESKKINQPTYFHCTTGEDRTGALAVLYMKSQNKNLQLDNVFRPEMCEKGYESGEIFKPKDIVKNIRNGLSLNFLKTFYVINLTQQNNLPLSDKMCDYHFENDQNFLNSDFANANRFNCENPEFN